MIELSATLLGLWGMQFGSVNRTVPCTGGDFADCYTTNTGWTAVGSNVEVANGVARAVTASCESDNRIHKALGLTLTDTLWYYNFEIKPQTSDGAATGAVALSAGTGALSTSTQDSIGLYINTTPGLRLFYKDGAGAVTLVTTEITGVAGTLYYGRLLRDSATGVTLQLFSNSARTSHITGSPQSGTIPSTVIGLTHLQHSVASDGGAGTDASFEVDETHIYDNATP